MSPRVFDASTQHFKKPLYPTIDAQFLFCALRRQAKFLIFFALLGVLIAGLFLVTKTPTYTATATIVLRSEEPKILVGDAAKPVELVDRLYVESQISLLRSTRIASRVMQGIAAEEHAENFDEAAQQNWLTRWVSSVAVSILSRVRGALTGGERTPGNPTAEMQESLNKQLMIEAYLDHLQIERAGRSYLLEVRFTDKNAERAARLANAHVKAYFSDRVASKAAGNRAAHNRVEQQLAALSEEIQSRERQIQEFRVTHRILDVADATVEQNQITNSTIELLLLREKLLEAETRLQQQRASSNEARPEDDTAGALKRHVERLKALEAEHLEKRDNIIKLNELKRKLVASGELYSHLLRRNKEIEAEGMSINADAFVVAPAVPPYWPSGPRKRTVFAAISFVWLILLMLVALARELTRRTLLSRSDVEQAFGLACIAEIPAVSHFPPANGTKSTGWLSIAQGADIESPIYWNVNEEAHGAFNQEIFRLKHWVESVSRRSKSILFVVSPNRGEGRSSISIQIARFAAASGSRVCLVDGDLRTAGLTKTLGLCHKTKNFDAAAKESPTGKTLQAIKYEDFTICPAPVDGEVQPLNLLASAAVKSYLKAARERYDLIVIDTPPMRDYADAIALLDSADAAIIVVRHAQTEKNDVRVVISQLETTQLPNAAIVLNRCPPFKRC